jgi:hypothetical protein
VSHRSSRRTSAARRRANPRSSSLHSFPVLIALRGTGNKCVNRDEVREGYSGASITHLELVLLQAA